MSEQTPVEAAIAAYDANLNEQLGNPPGHVLGPDLRDSPPIVAMLTAHERALREQIAKDIEMEAEATKQSRLATRQRAPREEAAFRVSAHIARGGWCLANPNGVANRAATGTEE